MRFQIAAALTIAAIAPPFAQKDNLRAVLDRASAYLVEYRQQLTTVIAREHYEQSVRPPQPTGGPNHRVLISEYLLLRGEEHAPLWAGFRDVISVDGTPLGGAEGRLEQLLKSRDDVPARASALALESARYNIGNVLRTINVPTFALEYLTAANRDRVKTRKAGEQTIEGVSTWMIEFEERGSPTLIHHPNGGDVRAHGTWWIDPASGRTSRTELATAKPVSAKIVVDYARDAHLNLWVPRTMDETYQTPGGHIRGTAQYSDYRQFTTSGRLITR